MSSDFAGLKCLRENLCRPYGSQFHFPLYPALRLRLRAGLSSSAPTALVFRASYSTAETLKLVLTQTLKPGASTGIDGAAKAAPLQNHTGRSFSSICEAGSG